MNLDDDKIKVAKIAKVREKVSDGEQEFDNPEDAEEDIPESERHPVIVQETDDSEEIIFPVEESDE